eukprot:TRINITY_DN1250_c0_g1_i2.p1 TRINITY_DN1250_c0_g1~~TRINITY_DN1250_c0_g1_i2.p1  ORF type:complete len:335 (+),score=23.28 TRINITY_DN1250_c0_g1_i2:141-1007(+)
MTNKEHWKFATVFIIQTLIFTVVITLWVFAPRRGKVEVEVWTQKFGAELLTSSGILGPLALEGALGKEFMPLAFLTVINTMAVQLPLLQIMLEQQFNDEELSPIILRTTHQKSQKSLEMWNTKKNTENKEKIQNGRRSLEQFDSTIKDKNQQTRLRKSLDQKYLSFHVANQKIDENVQEIFVSCENYIQQQNQKSRERKWLWWEHLNLDSENNQNEKESLVDTNNLKDYVEQKFVLSTKNQSSTHKIQKICSFAKKIFTRLVQNLLIWSIIVGILISVTGLREFEFRF